MIEMKWRLSKKDGTLDDEIVFEMAAADVSDMKARYARYAALADGPEKAGLFNEIRTMMDLFAGFGCEVVPPPPPPIQITPEEAPHGPWMGVTGKYSGSDATPTEAAAGAAKELDDLGPIKKGTVIHTALLAFSSGERMTAYDASVEATGDYHAIRREAGRLVDRKLLAEEGELPNRAPHGRGSVKAYQITPLGFSELARLM